MLSLLRKRFVPNSQAGLQIRAVLSPLLNSEITGMCHHAQFISVQEIESIQGFKHAREVVCQLSTSVVGFQSTEPMAFGGLQTLGCILVCGGDNL